MRKLDPPVKAALGLGAYQLGYLDGVPRYAAVNESVELVRPARLERAVPFTNAVLRRLADGIAQLLAGLPEGPLKHSYPDWVWEVWRRDLGEEEALALMRAQNEPPTRRRQTCPGTDPGRVRTDMFRTPTRSSGSMKKRWKTGDLAAEPRLAARGSLRRRAPGERVLDLCAAPGGKATMLAGEVVAVEVNEARARELEENARRLAPTTHRRRTRTAVRFRPS